MDKMGTVEEALARAEGAVGGAPAVALAQAEAVLEVVPGHPRAVLVRGAALVRLGALAEARAVLEPLVAAQPRAALVHVEWGVLLLRLGELAGAEAALRRAVALRPALPQAWRALGDVLFLAGRAAEADAAYARQLRESVHDPALMAAGDALVRGDLPAAEQRLRAFVRAAPTDVAALRMLAEVGTRLGRYEAAARLLERCLQLAPGFAAARFQYAVVLYRQNRALDALPEIARLCAESPEDGNFLVLHAACLASVGRYEAAIGIYEALLARGGAMPKLLLGYGHALRTAGRREAAIAAYRRVLAGNAACGEAWWSLANLKIGVLGEADLAAMRRALAAPGLAEDDRVQLLYAIGRVEEEAGRADAAFAAYAEGARLRRAAVGYDPAVTALQVARSIATFSPAFFAARAGVGCADPAPIFIVGLPRSGSTLIEQMLASHSLVEGTMELPEMVTVARGLGAPQDYPQCLASLPVDRLREAGVAYLARAKAYRQTDKPFFIDKLPNNWLHVGLIAVCLPRAKIIDARRDGVAACFSAFTQYFARGQHYSYGLEDLGRYYIDYARLMAHLDVVLPGRVHRVMYEDMVERTEDTLKALLAFCELPFEAGCLDFHRNTRPVRTASSEQVRQPLYATRLRPQAAFIGHLGPLCAALGEAG